MNCLTLCDCLTLYEWFNFYVTIKKILVIIHLLLNFSDINLNFYIRNKMYGILEQHYHDILILKNNFNWLTLMFKLSD